MCSLLRRRTREGRLRLVRRGAVPPASSPVARFPPVGRGQWRCHVGPGQLWSLAGVPPSWQLAARGLAVSEINAQTSTIVQMSPFRKARALFFFLYCLLLLLLFFFFFFFLRGGFFVSMLLCGVHVHSDVMLGAVEKRYGKWHLWSVRLVPVM